MNSFLAEELFDLITPCGHTMVDQGQGAGPEYETTAEEGMQDCPLLAAAHNYVEQCYGK